MGQKPQILVDTDILIKVYRGHAFYKAVLDKEENNLAISSVTYLELLFGLKTRGRIVDLNKQMRAYQLIHISETISIKALQIVNKYAVSNSIKVSDALIGATALVNNFQLFTDNKQDFGFIKGLSFYNL
jgi:predicted nucleic acid-binding protein